MPCARPPRLFHELVELAVGCAKVDVAVSVVLGRLPDLDASDLDPLEPKRVGGEADHLDTTVGRSSCKDKAEDSQDRQSKTQAPISGPDTCPLQVRVSAGKAPGWSPSLPRTRRPAAG